MPSIKTYISDSLDNLWSARINRSKFWTAAFIGMQVRVIQFITSIDTYEYFLTAIYNKDYLNFFLILILIVTVDLCLILFITIEGIKRIQDTGNKWYYYFIPIYNFILCGFVKSHPNPSHLNKLNSEQSTDASPELDPISQFLISGLISSSIYAIISLTSLIDNSDIKSIIFLISFTISQYVIYYKFNRI